MKKRTLVSMCMTNSHEVDSASFGLHVYAKNASLVCAILIVNFRSSEAGNSLICQNVCCFAGFACLFMWCFHGRTLDVIAMSCDKDTTRGFGPLVPGHLKVDFGDIDGLKKIFEGNLSV